jgi:hypothetical protein
MTTVPSKPNLEVALRALELTVALWPDKGSDVPTLDPELWGRLRRFLLDVPEILGV